MMPDRCRDTLALLTEPLAQAADTLKLILIDHYPHLFSPAALRPLATRHPSNFPGTDRSVRIPVDRDH